MIKLNAVPGWGATSGRVSGEDAASPSSTASSIHAILFAQNHGLGAIYENTRIINVKS